MGHVRIFGSVDAERRGRLRRHPVQRAGQDMLVPRLFQIAAQKQRQNLSRVHAGAIGLREVAGTVHIHDAGHRTGLVGVPAFTLELPDARSHTQKLGQMPTG